MSAAAQTTATISFLSLEVTGRCQMSCTHCYAHSGPQGTHGEMTEQDWIDIITAGTEVGVTRVQFIGGEPLIYPPLPRLIAHALSLGLDVEVYSNLLTVSDRMWAVLSQPGIRLGASYYSADPAEHEQITGLRGSHAKTRANIAKAVRLGIPIRIGMVELLDGQDIEGAYRDLASIGIPAEGIRVDRLRHVGRGAELVEDPQPVFCGRCVEGQVAVLPNGDVHPCVLSRVTEPVGNVLHQPLLDTLTGVALQERRAELARSSRPGAQGCDPGNGCFPPPRVYPAGVDGWVSAS
jgi:MoaA/NifB/PqqE/SkfB family radical SAM enzyme